MLDWALISGDIRFDCLDVVDVSPEGLVARKDTFVDMVQLQAAIGAVTHDGRNGGRAAAARQRAAGGAPLRHACRPRAGAADLDTGRHPADVHHTGGVVDGPKLQGEILPGGGDWLLVGSDGRPGGCPCDDPHP